MTVVVGTAGHIDHGKTTLLRALTGIDGDRLPEERARGMTIDVGYAHLAFADGEELDFVDVPGHDRLVGNMLVGAGEIDSALLVVAADDGPRAQTLEHLELLDALGIRIGLAVVTKVDAVPAERVAEVVAEVAELLARTMLAGRPVVPASATTAAGLAAIHVALRGIRDEVVIGSGPLDPARARVAIDRIFTVRGRGTVVTGTLRGGPIEPGAVLRVVPDPAGRSVRVREVQVHGRTVDRAGPGRVALNIAGSGALAALERGTVLTTDPEVVATDRVLVALRPSIALGRAGPGRDATGRGGDGTTPAPLPGDRAAVALHLGTARVGGRLGRGGRDGHDLGDGEGSAIVRLDHPIAVAAGDRFVVRRPSPAGTLAGGRVRDPEPPRGVARRRATAERIRALAAAPPATDAWRAARLELHGAGPASGDLADDVAAAVDAALVANVDGRGSARTPELVRVGAAIVRRLVGHAGPAADTGSGDRAAAARLDRLIADGRLVRDADVIRVAGSRASGPSPELVAAMDRLVAALATATPPALSEAARVAGCPPDGVRALEAERRIVRVDRDLAWAGPTYRALAGRALAMAGASPLTPAALRDATGTSRKFVMALLEDLDRRAILRRTPDGHVPGARAGIAVATAEVAPGRDTDP